MAYAPVVLLAVPPADFRAALVFHVASFVSACWDDLASLQQSLGTPLCCLVCL